MISFNKALIITGLFVISFLTSLDAQKNEWLIEPIITEADKFMNIFPEYELVELVNESNEKGVKNFRNEVVIPMEYSHISIFTSRDYIAGNKGSTQFAWDREGYEIDLYSSEDRSRDSDKKNKAENAAYIDEFNTSNKDFQIVRLQENDQRFGVINDQKDTIINFMYGPKNFKLINGKYLGFKFKDRITRILDKNGKVYFETDDHVKFQDDDPTGLIKVKADKWFLFDENMNPLHENIRDLYTIPEYEIYVITDEDSHYMYDKNRERVNNESAKYIARWQRDEGLFAIGFEDHIIFYNAETGKTTKGDFKLFRMDKSSTRQVVNQDTLYGIYDIVTNEMAVPIQYRSLKRLGSYFTANTEKYNRKTKKPINQILLDKDGNVVFEEVGKGINSLSNQAFLFTDSEGKTHLYNKNAELVMTAEEDQKFVTSKSSHWMYVSQNSSRMAYSVSDLLDGKKPRSYVKIGDTFPKTEEGAQAITLVQNKDSKYGAVNQEGELVIPVEYDSIKKSYLDTKKYLEVKKDGKLGIMIRP